MPEPPEQEYGVAPKQAWAALHCNRRINIYEGAIRSGKTVGSIMPWVQHVTTAPAGELFMIGKTLETLERNVLRPAQAMLGEADFAYKLGAKEAYLDGRRLSLLSAYNTRSFTKLRGATCAGWYGDELTLWPENFYTELLGRMSVEGAKGIGTTNPDSPFHWLKKQYLNRSAELNWRNFKFRLDDNPFLPASYKAAIAEEYSGLFYQRLILGLWVLAAGTVYSMFDPDKHIREAPGYFPHYGVAMDYGTANPTVFGLFGYGHKPRHAHLLDLYYYDSNENGITKTDSQYGDEFEAFIDGHHIENIVCDPSAKSFIAELKSRGHYVKFADNTVVEGIRFVSTCLQKERLLLDKTTALQPAIDEFGSYVWDENAQQKGQDKPLKKYDHCMDMIRYFMYTLFFDRDPTVKAARMN